MNHQEHIAQKPSTVTGFRALLSKLFTAKGTSVSKISWLKGNGASKIGRVLLTTMLTLTGGLLLTGTAFGAEPEKPLTEPASGETATSAVLHGTLNPGATVKGEPGSYQFSYALAETGGCAGSFAPASPAFANGDAAEPVETTVTGLEPNREYLFCVVAYSLVGVTEPSSGTPVSFTTSPAKPSIAVGSENASSATGTGATLAAQVDGNNESTSYKFEYSTKGKTGAGEKLEAPIVTVAGGSAIEGYGDQTVSVATGVLTPGTSYFYRVVATNGTGTEDGPVQEFATVPTPTTEPVTPIGASTATFNGKLTPLNLTVPAEYYFEYNRGEELVCTNEDATTPESAGAEAVSTAVTGLEPDQKYTVCLVSKNAFGSEEDLVSPPVHFTTKPAPPTIESETSPALATEGATLEAIVNPNNQETTCEFEYGSEASLATHTTVPCPASLGNGGAGVGTSITVAGLKPETIYYYRVVATNATGETKGTEVEPIKEFKTEPAQAPTIAGEYVTKVQETTVTLNAQINPNAAATTCQFEYGTETGVYPNEVPCSPQQLGAGTSPVTVSAPLTGLTPDTTYHYHVVASNVLSPAGGTPGADQAFTTNPAPSTAAESCPNARARAEQPYGQALPDCRAYELVSPLEKSGFSVEAINSRASVSDGEPGEEASAVAYVSKGSFTEPQGARKESRYISRRGTDGWSTQNVTPLSLAFNPQSVAFQELVFTPSLSQGILFSEDVPLIEHEESGYRNLYVADLASSPVSYQKVTTVNPPGEERYPVGELAGKPEVVGASTDLSHVVFQQHANLTANAEGELEHVYEWAAGKLSLVDVPPAGTKFERQDSAGAPGSFLEPEQGDTWHAVSANGQRVFFTAGSQADATSSSDAGLVGQLYVRENPEQEQSPEPAGKCTVPTDACTVEVSASQRTTPDLNGPQPAYFRDANATGTRVFFTSRAELTYNANTGSADNTANLYEYNVETGVLSDITPENSEGAAVLGLVTAGENAGEENSYVYFVANGVLASNENANKETAQPGTCKEKEGEALTGEHTCDLYVAHYDNGKWETKFIAALVAADGTSSNPHGDEADWIGFEGGSLDQDKGPGQHTARVTPDGTTLAFESQRSLTGYDNEPLEPGAGAEEHKCTELGGAPNNSDPAVPCREVYVYNAATEKLVCTSCDPSGGRPVGDAELGGQEEEAANGLLHPSVYYLPRNLSESGGRLFFQSPDALVPRDSNNQLDVYEWEQPASPAEAENSCTSSSSTFSASDGGCVFPISDVAGDFESRFMDATPSGNNVFIKTKDQLVPEADADSRANVYDVRVGGGFPVTTSPPSCNNGDSCKPPVSPQPSIFGAGPTETLSAPGNPAPTVASVVTPKKKTAAEIKAEQLAKALKQCHKDKKKAKRTSCEKQSRKKYGATKAKKSAKANRRASR